MHAGVRLPHHFRGFSDRTHGGIVSTLLDEAMGWATVRYHNRFSYTGELAVRFREPVPVMADLSVRGKVVRHTRRLDFTVAELRSAEGRLLASAEGKFVLVSPEQTATMADALIYTPDCWRP